MDCPIQVTDVVWNLCHDVSVEISVRRDSNLNRITITPLDTTAYSIASNSHQDVSLSASRTKATISIHLKHLDELKTTDTRQEVLGEIQLCFKVKSFRTNSDPVQFPDDEQIKCPLKVKSPYAHPFTNPTTAHVRHTSCSCRITESNDRANLPPRCILQSSDQLNDVAAKTDRTVPNIHIPRTATIKTLIQEMNRLAAEPERKIIWFHGWPGCGKTTLLQDLVQKLTEQTGRQQPGTDRWVPVHLHIKEDNNGILRTTWQLMWEVDRAIQKAMWQILGANDHTTPEAEERLLKAMAKMHEPTAVDDENIREDLRERDYWQDPHLIRSWQFLQSLNNVLTRDSSPADRVLVILDGIYYFQDIGDELYLNLARLGYLFQKLPRFLLLVTDVMPFDKRLENVQNKIAEQTQIALRGLEHLLEHLECPSLSPAEIEQFFTKVFGNELATQDRNLMNRLEKASGKKPILLKLLLHQAKWLYQNQQPPHDLTLSRCSAQQLRQIYYQQDILDENENRILRMLLDGQGQRLIHYFNEQDQEKIITKLIKKGLIRRSKGNPMPLWIIEDD